MCPFLPTVSSVPGFEPDLRYCHQEHAVKCLAVSEPAVCCRTKRPIYLCSSYNSDIFLVFVVCVFAFVMKAQWKREASPRSLLHCESPWMLQSVL